MEESQEPVALFFHTIKAETSLRPSSSSGVDRS
jgi:hypothetical protein